MFELRELKEKIEELYVKKLLDERGQYGLYCKNE
jgi:hypothetical protein